MLNRRYFSGLVGLAVIGAGILPAGAAETATPPPGKLAVGILVYPDMVLLDLVGAQTALTLAMADIHLVWKSRSPVATDVGLAVMPTTTFADCPAKLDVLLVPGGLAGTVALLQDAETIEFLRSRGTQSRFQTSVCTGSLLLGAAGLLQGRRATSHWYVRDLLPLFGAKPSEERVVQDGTVMTGAGVTAGLDFGLALVALLRGEDYAKLVQLVLEYAPKPPFAAGTPIEAGADLTAAVLSRRRPLLQKARAAAEQAAAHLRT